MLDKRHNSRCPPVTRLICPKCESSVDLVGNHKHARQECIRIGCDGIMTRYRPNPQAFRCNTHEIKLNPPVIGRPESHEPFPSFKNYSDYLKSNLWYSIRAKVFRRDKGKCRLCDNPGQEVHHLSYAKAVMEGNNTRLLVLLCCSCHKRVEFGRSGKKRSVQQAARAFWSITNQASEKPKKRKTRNHRVRQTTTKRPGFDIKVFGSPTAEASAAASRPLAQEQDSIEKSDDSNQAATRFGRLTLLSSNAVRSGIPPHCPTEEVGNLPERQVF